MTGPAEGGVCVADGTLIDDMDGEGTAVADIAAIATLPGAHNAQNAAAAYAAAERFPEAAEAKTFLPVVDTVVELLEQHLQSGSALVFCGSRSRTALRVSHGSVRSVAAHAGRSERDRFVSFVLESVDNIPAEDRLRGMARFLDDHHLQVGDDLIVCAERIVIATGWDRAVVRPEPAALARSLKV